MGQFWTNRGTFGQMQGRFWTIGGHFWTIEGGFGQLHFQLSKSAPQLSKSAPQLSKTAPAIVQKRPCICPKVPLFVQNRPICPKTPPFVQKRPICPIPPQADRTPSGVILSATFLKQLLLEALSDFALDSAFSVPWSCCTFSQSDSGLIRGKEGGCITSQAAAAIAQLHLTQR